MDIRFGDVLFADLGKTDGCIQGGKRPCVVISNDIGNTYSPTILVVPLTSKCKKLNMPVHDILHKSNSNGLKSDSVALGEQVRAIDKGMVLKKLGYLNDDECDKIINIYLKNLPKRHSGRNVSYAM